jgi:hypothetical protein
VRLSAFSLVLKDRNETTRVFNLDISTTEQGSGSLGSAAAGIPS